MIQTLKDSWDLTSEENRLEDWEVGRQSKHWDFS